jgi:glycosyltransferase involved in cell wall biosynthesis
MSPRVSVVIPYYNTAEVVAETLDSVLAQTYTDYEIILVNDDSPDTARLERVLAPYAGKLKYIRTENRGVAAARNTAIRQARGELIAFIDSDDLWMPDYLSYQVGQLDADPSADIVYPNAVIFGAGESGRKLAMKLSRPTPEVTFSRLVTEECAVVVSALARKTALERVGLFDEQLCRCEDFDLWLRCVKANSRIIYHHEVLLRYRRRPGSLSSDPSRMAAHAAKVLRKMQQTAMLTEAERKTIEVQLRYFDGRHLFYEGKQAFFAGDYRVAVEKFQAANRYLKSMRMRLVILLLQTAPGFARRMHAWRYPEQNSQ